MKNPKELSSKKKQKYKNTKKQKTSTNRKSLQKNIAYVVMGA